MTRPPSRLRSTKAELIASRMGTPVAAALLQASNARNWICELVGSRIAITNQFLGSRIEVLFSAAHAFLERTRRALVENLEPAPRPFRHLDAEKPGIFIRSTRRQRPHLPGGKRVNDHSRDEVR